MDHFQPKLVINNIEVLKNAILLDESSSVSGSMYHDSLIWRIIALGANERCLRLVLVASDRSLAGMPKKPNCILLLINLVIQRLVDNKDGTFEDIVDSYLAYLQVSIGTNGARINPAMERVLEFLQKFVVDAHKGKISKDRLRFSAPWRHPPATDEPTLCTDWAKVQLMDFVQSFVNTEFGVNHLADCSLEIFDDPSAVALVELHTHVGLLYAQRDPCIIRSVSRAIQRCLVRWLVQERLKMGFRESLQCHGSV